MYTALYRTERPETFDQVLGQDHIVKILKNQVKTGTVGHAYLFCGTRGTGKTSVARILAKAVNCTGEGEKPCGECPSCKAIRAGNFLDVIEIDAATNNGIENIRELRESVNYPPSIGKKKVYIIDEAHELSTRALNGFLKTLEEPPEDVMFILATTDPQKLIQTILSRCLRLDFHRLSEEDLKKHMKNICEKRGVEITDEALSLLTSNADGSARDALSLLDQCLSGADSFLDRELVLEYLGAVSDDFYIRLIDLVNSGDISGALISLDRVLREGRDVKQVLSGMVSHYRSLLIGRFVDEPEALLNISKENVERLVVQAKSMSLDEINRGIMVLAETVNNARYSPQPRVLTELALVTLTSKTPSKKEINALNEEVKEPANQEHIVRSDQGTGDVAPITSTTKEILPEEPINNSVPDLDDAVTLNDASGEVNDEAELNDIWSDIWDKIEDLGSVTMVRINSTLAGISSTDFKIVVTNRVTKNVAEKNREMIEKAMEEVVGRHLKMVVNEGAPQKKAVQESFFQEVDPGREGDNLWDEFDANSGAESEGEASDFDDALKDEIESKLNINVRVED